MLPSDAEVTSQATLGAPGEKRHIHGTHRLVPPEETLRRIAAFSRSMGITRVANITGLDVIGVPVVAVMRPNSRSVAVAQGKGLDLVAAKVSGLMEAIENYHTERIRLPLVLGSWEEMRERGGTLDVRALPRVAGSTLDLRARLLWVQGHGAMSRARVWVPFEVVHTDYTLPLVAGSGAFTMSDSGVAAGNSALEAASHAICELVERDAVTLWRFMSESERKTRRVDLGTVDDDACRSVLDRFARADLRTAVWEVTSDVGIAAFFCTIVEESPNPWRRLYPASGSGCHPCREVALLRALTEAAQTRLTVIAGSRDDMSLAVYSGGEDQDALREAVRLLEDAPARSFSDGPTFSAGTFQGDVAWELDRLQSAGIEEVAIVDCTLSEYEIPVVRVVIPGLEGIDEGVGFAPGPRLRARLG